MILEKNSESETSSENGDLAKNRSEQAPSPDELTSGLTSGLKREELIIILSRLIKYAEGKVFSTRTPLPEKSTWARVLRESITELNRLTKGEDAGGDDLTEILKDVKLPMRTIKRLMEETKVSLRVEK